MRLDYVAPSEGQEDCALEGLILVFDQRVARSRAGRAGRPERPSPWRHVWARPTAPLGREWASRIFRRHPVPE